MAPDPLLTTRDTLQALRDGTITAHAASERLRDQPQLLGRLPPAFAVVLHQLLDRLESSALFDAESCSFSQRDLLDSLQLWIDRAAQRLA